MKKRKLAQDGENLKEDEPEEGECSDSDSEQSSYNVTPELSTNSETDNEEEQGSKINFCIFILSDFILLFKYIYLITNNINFIFKYSILILKKCKFIFVLDIAKTYPPCMRIIVKETNLPKLKVGSLFLVAYTGGSMGKEGDHSVIIPDINVSKVCNKKDFK